MAQRLTTDAIRALYPEDKWILLLPTVTKLTSDDSLIYGLDVTEVEINPDSPSMVYDNKGKDALSKVALDRLAAAAGISISSRRTDDRSSREYASYEATAIISNPGGEPIVRTANREWDGRDAADRIRIECEANIEKNSRGLTGADFERAVERRFREEMLREREISRAKTETKAINRAIAMILGMPRSFPRGVLATHRFAVAKYVLTPDMSDPDVKRAVIDRAFGSRPLLYGSPTHAAGQAVPPRALLAAPQAYEPEVDGDGASAAMRVAQEPTREPVDGVKQATADAAWSREVQEVLGDGMQVLPDDGPDAAWRRAEDHLPEITRMLAACRHPKAAEAKTRYLAAFRARDAVKIESVYNWLLDQEIAGGK